jgi:5-methylthioadenosine/S-adenosylhomocysteine deaminase
MPSVRYIWSLLFLLGTFVVQCAAQDVTLRGTLVTPDDVIPNGAISLSKNRIGKVGAARAEQNGTIIETDSFIFPGLIDLHNHITWNFLPRWKPNELFSNRYEWQQRAAYKVALDGPHGQLVLDHGLACDAGSGK